MKKSKSKNKAAFFRQFSRQSQISISNLKIHFSSRVYKLELRAEQQAAVRQSGASKENIQLTASDVNSTACRAEHKNLPCNIAYK